MTTIPKVRARCCCNAYSGRRFLRSRGFRGRCAGPGLSLRHGAGFPEAMVGYVAKIVLSCPEKSRPAPTPGLGSARAIRDGPRGCNLRRYFPWIKLFGSIAPPPLAAMEV
ncbi:unnamed protein product [Amoebophrya sp. A120]|nr:unnamed protein product [Amoebophrya sp. A120]|eukprot:GSA120T00014310001.1